MLRQRCALVICIGLGILAASLLVNLRAGYEYRMWNNFVDDGWVSGFGAIMALIGIYHWIARADMR